MTPERGTEPQGYKPLVVAIHESAQTFEQHRSHPRNANANYDPGGARRGGGDQCVSG